MDKSFEYIKYYNKIKFRYAKGKSIESGNEIHEYNEILYYIDGDATFLSENHYEELRKATLLIIPKEYYHKFEIKNQNAYNRLVLNFPQNYVPKEMVSVFGKISVICNITPDIAYIIERMCKVMTTSKEGAEHLLYALYHLLISELYFSGTDGYEPTHRVKNSVSARCVKYVEGNLGKKFTTCDIAAHLNISTSSLFHSFKSEMGTSLHKYITEKRLIYARRLIADGAKPSEVFEHCGYEDYSGFYKAFLKMFGYSPCKIKDEKNETQY